MFDIFLANDLIEPVHVGSADEVETARRQMGQLANEIPGWYFVWDTSNFRVIARIDTTEREKGRHDALLHSCGSR